MVDIFRRELSEGGIDIYEHCQIHSIEKTSTGAKIQLVVKDQCLLVEPSNVLVCSSVGPKLDLIDLSQTMIKFSETGILTDNSLRCIHNKKIYAINDIVCGYMVNHAMHYQTNILLRNIIFNESKEINYLLKPWVTYTTPGLAQVGLSSLLAEKLGYKYEVITAPLSHFSHYVKVLDKQPGIIKVLVNEKGRIMGCNIFDTRAGDLIIPWALAIQQDLDIAAIAYFLTPYPAFGKVVRKLMHFEIQLSQYKKNKLVSRFKQILHFFKKNVI